jgi:septum formation protein
MILFEKLKDYQIVLASNSPRRRELMSDAGFTFNVAEKYEIDEVYPSDMVAEEVAEYLSRLKSEGYPHPLTDKQILITADTVVIVGDQILGKPTDRADAQRMLQMLSGCSHKVVTGVTIRTASRTQSFSSVTSVEFRRMSTEEIAYYIDNYAPYDKAGAYGIQEWIGYVGIERIEGSFYNVMGLPVQRLYAELDKMF